MTLSHKQRQIIHKILTNNLPDIYIINGCTGSGKSWSVNMGLSLLFNEAQHGDQFMITGNTQESLYKNVITDLVRFDSSIQYKRNVGMLVTAGGAEIFCIGVNNENSDRRIQGGGVKLWYADEVTKYPRSAYNMCLSRCRWVIDGKLKSTPAIMTCNADAPRHYIKTDFIDTQKANIEYFGFWDNPMMTQEYIDSLNNKFSGTFYERMVMNRWSAAEGVVYDSFSRSKHVTKDIPYNRIISYAIGVDWGYNHPMCMVLVGIDKDGVIYVIKEFHESGRLVDQRLYDQLANDGWFRNCTSMSCFCDPSRPDYIDMLQAGIGKYGVSVCAADNSVIEGIQEVQKLLLQRGNGSYGLYIHESCVNQINGFENYHWKHDRDGSAKDEVVKENDDDVDCCRYVIYSTNKWRNQRSFIDTKKSDFKLANASW